jgi:hypothetical protein
MVGLDELIELVGDTQDGKSLRQKGNTRGDLISELILEVIGKNAHSEKINGIWKINNYNIDEIKDELDYVVKEITKARDCVANISERIDY